jgi:transcriptional regulator with XRE-family HTH domain
LFSASQIRAARALLGWSQAEVATAAGLSIPTIKRAEADGNIQVSEDALVTITRALKKAGVEFIAENGGGPGVRLRKSHVAYKPK